VTRLANFPAKLLRVFYLLVFLASVAVVINLVFIPTQNTAATHFDTIIVLGYPANPDGSPSPEQRERVLEAVREYKAGVAPNIIMTGAAAHNRFIEAHVMISLAIGQGVPTSALLGESHAQNTIQNIYYSASIMQQRNWHSAEVISSPDHLPRAAMILTAFNKKYPMTSIEWRTHPARWPTEYLLPKRIFLDAFEAARCLEIRLFGFPKSKFL
jgi:uncharacterized SAM-binding protein YcdF (DUF218 family)